MVSVVPHAQLVHPFVPRAPPLHTPHNTGCPAAAECMPRVDVFHAQTEHRHTRTTRRPLYPEVCWLVEELLGAGSGWAAHTHTSDMAFALSARLASRLSCVARPRAPPLRAPPLPRPAQERSQCSSTKQSAHHTLTSSQMSVSERVRAPACLRAVRAPRSDRGAEHTRRRRYQVAEPSGAATGCCWISIGV